MASSLRLGKLFGIDISVHISWFIVLVLLTWSLASRWFPQFLTGLPTSTYWIMGLISALLLFVCVLIHELAHALVARTHGLTVRGITLFIFGGIAQIDQEMKRPGVEFQVAIAGPIASFLLAGAAFLLALPLWGRSAPGVAILVYLATTNLLLGVFNLIPGYPLDGGRVLHAIIWKVTGNIQRSIRMASWVGQSCGYFFILLGLTEFFMGNAIGGLWTAFIGWFLLIAAQTSRTQVVLQSVLQGVSVAQVMNPQPVTVPANISLQKLVDEYFLPHSIHAAPVTQGDYLAGLISLPDIGRVERERWPSTPVGYVMRLSEQTYSVTPEQPLQDVFREMVARNINQVPVTQDGRLVGLLSRESIMRYLDIHQSLQANKCVLPC
jgi:Zn-dependent protease/CBS domain-containing protein